jgi:hypothetical protein
MACAPVAAPATSFVPVITADASTAPSAEPATTSPSTADPRTAGWKSDLALLVPGMDRYHPALDHGVSLDELNSTAADLSNRVPTASDDQLLVGVMRIVAMVSRKGCDGHLGAFVWGTGTFTVTSLPLRLWLFDDGVHIVDAIPPYEHLIGHRIESMGGRAMDDVLATLDPIVPRDNDQTVRLLMPRFLLIPQVLHGLGIIDDVASVQLQTSGSDAEPSTVDVEAIAMSGYNAWAGPYGLHLPEDARVLYLSDIGDDLWWRKLDDGTLFVQWNRVERTFFGDLEQAISDPSVGRIVIDVRHNFGGEVPVVDQMLPLFRNGDNEDEDELFVITGRNTLSAGSLFTTRMHDYTSAVIVGEPMGGCATFWGDVEELSLPYSGIVVSVPTMLEVGVEPDDTRLTIEPDVAAPLEFEDWLARRDPALDAIANYVR